VLTQGILKTHHFLASFSSFSTGHSHLLESVATSTSCHQEQYQLHLMPVSGRSTVAVDSKGKVGEGSNGWKVWLLSLPAGGSSSTGAAH